MSNGRVEEFDKPLSLLEKPGSLLSKMVEKTGPVASGGSFARQMAEDAAKTLQQSRTRISGLSFARETTL